MNHLCNRGNLWFFVGALPPGNGAPGLTRSALFGHSLTAGQNADLAEYLKSLEAEGGRPLDGREIVR